MKAMSTEGTAGRIAMTEGKPLGLEKKRANTHLCMYSKLAIKFSKIRS